MQKLSFDTYEKRYKSLFGKEGRKIGQITAIVDHALYVKDKLWSCATSQATIIKNLKNENALSQFKYGVLRRLLMVNNSYNVIFNVAYPKRKSPLDQDERASLDVNLNMLYINLRGVLDNLAWALLYEYDRDVIDLCEFEKYKSRVGLLSKEIRKHSQRYIWQHFQEVYGEWYFMMSDRRDPVAHRIPMYTVPKLLRGKEQEEIINLEEESDRALKMKNIGRAEALLEQAEKTGTFVPWFANHPYGEIHGFYPTIPEDLGWLIRIMSDVEDFVLKSSL